MYYARSIEDRVLDASRQFPAILVTGPRQVGKTTLLRHLCAVRRAHGALSRRSKGGDERGYVTLDDPSLRELANRDPALLLERFPPPVLIDEIQYAPGLLSYIKMSIDESRKPGAFWLTGSQQFLAMKGVSESLAGRVAIVNLLGMSSRERHGRELRLAPFLPTREVIGERTGSAGRTSLRPVFKDIWTGAYPALATGLVRDRDVFYGSYLQTYLERDVHDLARVGSRESFVRFVRACAARTGQMLNLAELARDVDVSPATAKSWLSVLTASLQVYLLPPYHSNVTKRLVKMPKLYFLDTGLAAYLTEWSTPEALSSGAMAGAVFETYVFGELLKSWWHRLRRPQVYYYRDRDGREIDFVFVANGTLHPVEVKLSATPRAEWARHFTTLERFSGKAGEGAVICLARDVVPLTRTASAVPVGLI